MTQSLRDFLDRLDDRGELLHIDEEIDPAYTLAGVLSLLEAGPATQFERVVGTRMRVVGNVVNSRHRVALALNVSERAISDRLLDAVARPIETRLVPSAVCQEVILPADLSALPIPRFFSQESGPYITASVILVNDALTGQHNMSFARFKVLGDRAAMLGVSPNHHLGKMAARAREAGRDLPIAVAIGTHPAIMLAACLYLGFGDDELECAGRLLGGPVDVVKAMDSDILVPAQAELVLEGVVKPQHTVPEGLVSEFHGRYHDYGPGLITEFTTVTHRRDPLFQVIMPGLHQEHVLLGGVAIAAGLLAHLQATVPGVVDVAVPDPGAGRTSAVVSVRSPGAGQARHIMMGCFAAVSLIKQVIVVDEEIDVWNVDAVEWARLSHARPERDFLIIPSARSDRSDPLARRLFLGKLGVDATSKEGERVEGWDFARVPGAALDQARAVLARVGVSRQTSRLLEGIGYPDAG